MEKKNTTISEAKQITGQIASNEYTASDTELCQVSLYYNNRDNMMEACVDRYFSKSEAEYHDDAVFIGSYEDCRKKADIQNLMTFVEHGPINYASLSSVIDALDIWYVKEASKYIAEILKGYFPVGTILRVLPMDTCMGICVKEPDSDDYEELLYSIGDPKDTYFTNDPHMVGTILLVWKVAGIGLHGDIMIQKDVNPRLEKYDPANNYGRIFMNDKGIDYPVVTIDEDSMVHIVEIGAPENGSTYARVSMAARNPELIPDIVL